MMALMANAALYFPYIEVPDRPELVRVLLYWDELGSIVPLSVEHQDRTRELVAAGLVRRVDPEEYYWDEEFAGFKEEFLELVDALPLTGHAAADPVPIHREKAMWQLWRELGKRRLARPSDSSWMEVRAPVAALFMAYLAGRLSRVETLDMHPITDRSDYFQSLVPTPAVDTAALFDELRGAVIRGVLPAPREPIDVRDLADFKERNWALLGDFRRNVESRLLECARERDPELRSMMVAQLRDDLVDYVEEITGRLHDVGRPSWGCCAPPWPPRPP